MNRQFISRAKTAFYRKPKDELKRLIRWGPNAYFNIEKWQRKMEEAAWKLAPPDLVALGPHAPTPIWFLTGKQFWYQTAFCAWTFARHSRHSIQPIILDDGSLDKSSIAGLSRLFPDLKVHSADACEQLVENLLPREVFPNIHRWRTKQLLFRKLTDIHAGSGDWRLFFDSDMLFFHPPDEIDKWIDDPDRCLVQRDCWESYGYSRGLTESLCGKKLPEAVNIGIFALNGASIDWEKIETWLVILEQMEGSRYNITQCVAAMLMAGNPLQILNAEDYKVWPKVPKEIGDHRLLNHYVSDSKPWYFSNAWKQQL